MNKRRRGRSRATRYALCGFVLVLLVAGACTNSGNDTSGDDGPVESGPTTTEGVPDTTALEAAEDDSTGVSGPVEVAGLSGVTSVTAGTSHSCALLSDGSVSCWGRNVSGQLGDGTRVDSSVPVPVSGLSGASALASGDDYSCALLSGGTVSCWGYMGLDQDGDVPFDVEGITNATAIAAEGGSSCALLADGTVSCWGTGIGRGAPTQIDGIADATAISTQCAVLVDGTVSCWGGSTGGENDPEPFSVKGISDAATMSGGDCVILGDGTVVCLESMPEFDSHFKLQSDLQSVVESLDGVTAISTAWDDGRNKTCGLLADGTVSCWKGELREGEPRSDTHFPRTHVFSEPVAVEDITDATAVATGIAHACALREAGVVSCWGAVEGLGDGSWEPDRPAGPKKVQQITDATAVSVGDGHACALMADGAVSCWGDNTSGQLGNGTGEPFSLVPVPVEGITDATAIAAAARRTCAIREAGTVSCWGEAAGGTPGESPTPVSVNGIPDATAISDLCAVVESGTVGCWAETPYPVTVRGVADATTISSTDFGPACALLADGTVSCWHRNGPATPGRGPGITDATAISTGLDRVCAILDGGAVSCWDEEDSSARFDWKARPASGISNAVSISVGPASCAAVSDGTVSCWGWNGRGQLGDGTFAPRLTPVTVHGLHEAVTVSTGGGYSCALLADGAVSCWGQMTPRPG
ncbi:MAG: hypothetical protein M5U31_12675 [Acidimicrobiia bacterium]|nr:hypothetical protein [Acidimicrobiia bacterium]